MHYQLKLLQLKKTDYINITDNDFYITNSNNKIILNSKEFNMKATDGIIYGEINVSNTAFSLNHSIQDIVSNNRFNIRSVLCNTLVVVDTGSIPKLNSRP